MTSINIIRSNDELISCIDAAVRAGWVAMDTEFLRERTYAPELCLIQVNGADWAACIDPLAIEDLSSLGALLGNPEVVKIFHSCRQDLEALDTRADIRAHNLYDTQLAAAFCGYGEQVSYAALVEAMCAVHLPKSHTRTDWSRRPLSRAQLDYALDDVNYLPALRCELDRLLEQKGRVSWHRDECVRAAAPANYRIDPNHAWQRLKGFERLDGAGQACARKLAVWREQKAQRRNLPRGWILSTPVLLQICRQRPNTLSSLAQIKEIAPNTVKHAGPEIIALLAQNEPGDERGDEPGDDAEVAATHHSPQPLLTTEQKRQVRAIMKLLEQRATQEEISRALLANRQEVENFVRGQTDLPLFAGWRAQLIGDEILASYS